MGTVGFLYRPVHRGDGPVRPVQRMVMRCFHRYLYPFLHIYDKPLPELQDQRDEVRSSRRNPRERPRGKGKTTGLENTETATDDQQRAEIQGSP